MSRLGKTLKMIFVPTGVILVVAATISGAVYFTNQQGHSDNQTNQTCSTRQHTSHKVTIQDDKATPAHTVASLCDTLTITNNDSTARLMAFGLHEDHVPYDGVGEKLLNKGQSLTVTLVQPGSFKFHDHIHDEVQGTFTVSKP